VLAGETVGEGYPVILLHGVTATRRYVVHGSKALPRRGYRLISYDARGHGESEPAPGGQSYDYPALAADLGRVIDEHCREPPVLAGHSMGCHTAAAFALSSPERVSALALIGPVTVGEPAPAEALAHWDRLADGIEGGGVDGFMEAYAADLAVKGEWRERALRITRERMERHRDLGAMARALREVARSVPFDGISRLESLELPALVVASRDEADPGHPNEVARARAGHLPRGELVSEGPGEAPLAWQGGRLSREIAGFCERAGVGVGRGGPPA
jgi:3-oxoadipate enol-lactonase